MRKLVSLFVFAATLVVGCGDNLEPPSPDAGAQPDAPLSCAACPGGNVYCAPPDTIGRPGCRCEPSDELCVP